MTRQQHTEDARSGSDTPSSLIRLRVLSLGAGVQSTTLALMAAHGEITPPLDCAIFADTQAEPQSVYDHLRWLMSPNVLPFPVHIVSDGDIVENLKKGSEGKRWASIPAFTRTGKTRQQCTTDFKIIPIHRKVRQLLGIYGKRSPTTPVVEQWIGLSKDEAHRMKDYDEPWWLRRYPLIERGMSRQDCLHWLRQHDYPEPPKSACVMCPNREASRWRLMKKNEPEEFAKAVEIDRMMRAGKFRGMRQQFYLHDSCRPLAEVDFSDLIDGPDPMGDECEGMCGV